jgi:hypothetical protein
MSGNDLARQVRNDPASDGLCLVALSGFGIESRMQAGEFDRHLLKPASIETVVDLLNSLSA